MVQLRGVEVIASEKNVIAELHAQRPWEYFGKWAALIIAVSFWSLWAALAYATEFKGFFMAWVGAGILLFVVFEAGMYIVLGPLNRPEVLSALIRDDSAQIRNRDGSERRIPFSSVKRIAISHFSGALYLWSGEICVLGYGFGGSQGDVLLKAYKEWAKDKEVDFIEYDTRDGVTSHPVKNVESVEGEERRPIEHALTER
jgi:hypothetical protein